MNFFQWLQQYNKAFVPLIMVGVYFINKHYGIDIPVDQDDLIMLFGALAALGVYQIPNKTLDK